jgi:hypothetical protein
MLSFLKLPRQRPLRKEETMNRQLELFEKQQRRWTETVWNSVLEETREEIVGLLGQMAKTKVRASRQPTRGKEKGVSDDA